MKPLPNRQSNRLKGYDYSRNGFYFITIVSQDNEERFGEIVDGEMVLNDAGKMVNSVWHKTIDPHPHISSDLYVIMPNHFHCLIEIDTYEGMRFEMDSTPTGLISNELQHVGAESISARPINPPHRDITVGSWVEMDSTPTNSISDIIQSFKRHTTIRYINGVKLGLVPRFRKRLWQRNYYDHIIRNEKEFMAIERYILNNPANWEQDRLRRKTGLMEEQATYGDHWQQWS